MGNKSKGCINLLIRLVIAGFIVASSAVIGVFVYAPISIYQDSPGAVSWQTLSDVPEKPVKISAVDQFGPFVESSTGKLFFCHIGVTQECWIGVSSIHLTFPAGDCGFCTPVPNPKAQIIDRAEYYQCVPGLCEHDWYALDADGKVWL